MSGYFGNTQAEQNEKLAEYRQYLQDREELDNRNLQANKNYLMTGVLPPSTQMKDTRTVSEKLKDIELLKRDIVSEFKGIYEPSVALGIVNALMSHPLNIDNRLVIYFAQNAPSLVKKLQEKYKYGLSGDASDIEGIVNIVSDYYNKAQDSLKSVKDYTSSLEGTANKTNLFSKDDIDKIKATLNGLTARVTTNLTQANRALLISIMNMIVRIDEVLPSNRTLEDLTLITQQQAITIPIDTRAQEAMRFLHELIKIMPSLQTVSTLFNRLEKAINSGNDVMTTDILQRIINLFTPASTLVNGPLSRDINIINEMNIKNKLKKIDEANLLAHNIERVQQGMANRANLPNNMRALPPAREVNAVQRTPPLEGHGLKKRQGRPVGSGIIREKPKSIKVEKYSGFGINEINNKKLDEKNILTIRRKNHTNYMDLPSKMVSPTLKNIIKSITGGKVPNYEDIKGLNEEEQNYLHKVLAKSNLLDKFTVPTPSKDKQEKDIHEFEVMKGEIMSGNDSKELIKKFKLHITKLARSGVLPRNETNEILLTLAELGY